MHMACQEGHLRIVTLLVKHHADLDLKDSNGKGEPPLFRAVGLGHLRIVKFLISNGCSVNLRRGGPKGDTALHLACAYGRFRETVELVRAGARIAAVDEDGNPPSHYAIAGAHYKIADFLTKNRAMARNSSVPLDAEATDAGPKKNAVKKTAAE